MNKKIILIGMPLLLIVFVAAATLYYSVTRDVHVDASFLFTGDNADDVSISAGETVISNDLLIESQTSVNVPLSIETTITPETTEATSTINFLLDNSAGTCLPYPSPTCEKRIFIQPSDVGITTLNDLNTIEWDANVFSGYLPHVDVILETDGLVFEYDKVDDGCGNGVPYPTGEMDTFGDKGIVDGNAYAWLNSGAAGNCQGDPDYTVYTLNEWKALRGDEKVLRFEIEIDNWISPSNSNVKNILINGNPVEVTLKPSDALDFNVETEFGVGALPDDYTITTEVATR